LGDLFCPGGVWPAGLVGTGDEGELLGEAEGRGRGERVADGEADGKGPACGSGWDGPTAPWPR
jgi:hypothetical protein